MPFKLRQARALQLSSNDCQPHSLIKSERGCSLGPGKTIVVVAGTKLHSIFSQL